MLAFYVGAPGNAADRKQPHGSIIPLSESCPHSPTTASPALGSSSAACCHCDLGQDEHHAPLGFIRVKHEKGCSGVVGSLYKALGATEWEKNKASASAFSHSSKIVSKQINYFRVSFK